jgi:hypothetical protein
VFAGGGEGLLDEDSVGLGDNDSDGDGDSEGDGEAVADVDADGEEDSVGVGEGLGEDEVEEETDGDGVAVVLAELPYLSSLCLSFGGAVLEDDEDAGELVVPVLDELLPLEDGVGPDEERGSLPARCGSGGGMGLASTSSSGCGEAVGGRTVMERVLLVAFRSCPTVMNTGWAPCRS